MIIQSKRIWVVNTWLAAQVEVEEGKIVNIYPYGEKDVDEVVKLDKYYIENWNLGLDIKILLKTVLVVVCKKGAV